MIEMSLADLRQPVMVTKALSASSAAKSRLGMSWAGVDRADLTARRAAETGSLMSDTDKTMGPDG